MRTRSKILLLFLASCLIELAFGGYYFYQATGPLAPIIAEHTAALNSGTFPQASAIDLQNDPWTKVAHFESTMGRMQFMVDTLFSVVIAWVLIVGGLSAAIARYSRTLSPNIHISRGFYILIIGVVYALINFPLSISGYVISTLRGTYFATPDVLIFGILTDLVVGSIFALLSFIPFYSSHSTASESHLKTRHCALKSKGSHRKPALISPIVSIFQRQVQ